MQEKIPLFHCRQKDPESCQWEKGTGEEGEHRLTFIQLSGSTHTVSPPPVTPRTTTTTRKPAANTTFVFFQNVLVRLKVFQFVREHTSLRCVLSHDPDCADWTFTSGGQGHHQRVCPRRSCMQRRVWVCMRTRVCVRVYGRFARVYVSCTQEWSALLLHRRKRPTARPSLHSDQSATLPVRACPYWWAGL